MQLHPRSVDLGALCWSVFQYRGKLIPGRLNLHNKCIFLYMCKKNSFFIIIWLTNIPKGKKSVIALYTRSYTW